AETTVLHHVGYISKLHAEPKIRFIRAKTVHSLLPGHPLNRKLHFNAQHFLEKPLKIALVDLDHIIYIYEGKLHIDLRKLRLTVRTKILIPKAPGNLDIAVHARTHQQLLIELRGLRKSVKTPWMHTTWHQIVPCPFRRSLSQHRCLHLQE